ncbi:MAG: triose-phosphate isomerase [Melioribacteraceae bacterium]|nr:triose-phosphate isomerase [Melioribacteraceae bacterium]MCF8264964.1 triose-phosphate isomerase [Melioribacteraceae bacterium]MCF8411772.1 triose-phosphate isomerase [Melioribacteraceae bacterium]MCF8431408.1 triose-phosphate isomerase [Melioribacteraceae bacterium]
MRKKVIAGNWKMNNDLSGAVELISGIKGNYEPSENVKAIICPPFISLETAAELLKGTDISLGAQNMSEEDGGAFTGEISHSMLKSVGCEYVILGHSERRTIYNESDELINKKIHKALETGLKPIFCIGESLEQRESGVTNDVVSEQVKKGLDGVSEEALENVIIAYEPIWAIGTGKTASPQQAQDVHETIRNLIGELYSDSAASKIIIQYGGSVKPDNALELLSQKDIDGALVGGACLKAESFAAIINAGK